MRYFRNNINKKEKERWKGNLHTSSPQTCSFGAHLHGNEELIDIILSYEPNSNEKA